MTDTLLISDLHLGLERPAINAAFYGFLDLAARSASALYILGDLFDYWIGDDDLVDPFCAQIAAALAGLARSGCAVHLMHGNRDFLIGERFCAAAGVRLLADPSLVEVGRVRTLLLHGDTLCLDDPDYQSFRARVRTPAWQEAILAKSMAERRRIARGLRADSRSSQEAKTEQIMDVAERAVVAAFRRFDCDRMIHGHTHRPARHVLQVDGRTRERWVLADWYTRGSFLRIDAHGACQALVTDAGA